MAGSQQFTRLTTVEYEDSLDLIGSASAALNLSQDYIRDALRSAGDRVGRLLRLNGNPISIESNAVNIGGIAGLLRVLPRLELEIVPKFLDKNTLGWREDFFYLSMLSQHGRLLASERLASAPGSRDDLATLVGRAIVGMYWDNHRRPLRTYRRSRILEFALDGDIEAETLTIPNADGYEQEVVTYDRQNGFNATILEAVHILMNEVRDPQTRRLLVRVAQVLAPQQRPRRLGPSSVPSRSKRWQSLYDLSMDVVKGFGITFSPDWARSPGFVLDTWRVWEDILTLGLRLGLGAANVHSQEAHSLGFRELPSSSDNIARRRIFNVVPDVTIRADNQIAVLVDAKYKTRFNEGRTRVSSSDVYEALAFSRATNCNHVFLGYPAPIGPRLGQPGASRIFERVVVNDITISGIHIEIQDISKTGGLRIFAQNVSRDISAFID